MKQTILLIIIVAAFLGTAVFLYRFLTGGPVILPNGTEGAEEKLSEIRKIKTLRLDLQIFTDPFFKSLASPPPIVPIGTTTGAVVPGRANPFVPF